MSHATFPQRGPRFRPVRLVRLLFASITLAAGLAHAEFDPQRALPIVSPSADAFAFGTAVAMLDFDGDGSLELAVADLREAPADAPIRGVVYIFHNTPFGWQELSTYDLQSASARFGATLAVGDFDEDGRDDLLIGAPGVGSGGGGVYLVRHIDPTTTIMDGVILNGGPSGGECGSSLTVGDFNDDGHLDFATGCPSASFSGLTAVGQVHRAYGFGDGSFNFGFLSQQTAGVGGVAETGDRFGAALAAGDFNCDGVDDLAIGVPFESVDGGVETGALHVLLGAAVTGLSGTGSQLWHQGVADVPGLSGDNDHFAAALAAADFDGTFISPCDDLAIGIPDDAESARGAVLVLSGSPNALVATGAELITALDFPQDASTNPGAQTPGNNHRFGASLLAARLGRGRAADLVIGVQGWTPASLPPNSTPPQPGMVCIAYATAASIVGNGQQCMNGGQMGGAAATDVHFGLAVAAGPLDNAPDHDLLIGSAGANQAFLLGNILFRSGFEGVGQ